MERLDEREPAGAVEEVRLGPTVAVGGDGIGRLADGRVVFVEGALPGERAEVELVEQRRDYARGRLRRVLDAAPGRVAPPCPERARGCGGCGWQHVDADLQVELKAASVADALRRIGRLAEPPEPGVLRLPAAGYRTTVHLAVDGAGRPAYRRGHSHELVAPASCLVTHPRLEELVVGARFPGADRVTLRVGVAGGERLAVPAAGRGGAAGAGLASAAVVPPDVAVVGPGGRAALHEDAGGRRWRVSARSFFQPGPAAASALADLVEHTLAGAAGPGDRLVDLYAGVGLLGGVAAARRGAALVAVEQGRPAAADARHNLADLDAEVVAGEVGAWRPRPAAAVIADPARPGLGRPGVAAVDGTGAAVLVLVSCDPASLGRDAGLLTAGGWALEAVTVVDAFPHTPHIECVSRFVRG